MDRAPEAAQLTPCRQCGTPFQPRKPWQRFDTKACRRAFHKATGGGDLAKRVTALEAEVRELRQLLQPVR